ncbi:MAG TPA: hypothetical protein VEJ16_03645 [Alphaproteobacteria bacterium]|nr:hypothetical protein [Alphaproteobacteria bacterium]
MAGAVRAGIAFPVDPPIPVPKPGTSPTARTIELPSVLSPFASPDTPDGTTAEGQAPRADKLPGDATGQGKNADLRLEFPAGPKTTVTPTLRLDGNGTTNPNDIRVSPPRDQEFNPAPGLGASVDLGDVTVDANVSQPLKGSGPRIGPDGRVTSDGTNVGVDMKMRF